MAGYDWIGTAHVPDGVEMRLMQRGDDFMILLERDDLMSTHVSASEEALATMTRDRLGMATGQEWLIGGYGLGFTLRAALAVVRADATLTVAEIVPEIIEWARGPMERLTAGCLDDPRVVVVKDDVAMLIDAASEAYDAILLDVDNGPDGLTRRVNDDLYGRDGLVAARAALRPGGILAIWSAHPDRHFVNRLRDVGFLVDEVDVSEGPDDQGNRHVIWFAKKP
ncbi:spermidine synthase [Novosphingobium flavum]|uniref:Spermidine synthase n=1 Tax=Novosphingobium flavum TaxID=1778672 RepID=A0A7X1FQZ4_9SPHN|nr:spermidine synthase [Novosphingobium flavum]MBC2665313.1 spermidine synthase [Novosphingobium flavum]